MYCSKLHLEVAVFVFEGVRYPSGMPGEVRGDISTIYIVVSAEYENGIARVSHDEPLGKICFFADIIDK